MNTTPQRQNGKWSYSVGIVTLGTKMKIECVCHIQVILRSQGSDSSYRSGKGMSPRTSLDMVAKQDMSFFHAEN
jgi:hypothetical protein